MNMQGDRNELGGTRSTVAKTALVLGANGGVGSEAVAALRRHGWNVRALVRKPHAGERDGIEWIVGDAMRGADVHAAAQGADLIVHAVNPAGYHNWAGLVLPMLDNTIAAAAAAGARIVLPGTVYNYGADAFPQLTETSPQRPHTRKGLIRVEMEKRLEAAAARGVRSLILRCGDFFGPRAGNNWFSQGLIRSGAPLRQVRYPGAFEIEHAWAYLPDVGETLSRLVARDAELADFATFHFGGHWLRGDAMIAAIRRAAGNQNIKALRFPWWAATLAAPFMETLREMREMRYLWAAPIRLDETRLVQFLGRVPHTPIDEAVRATLVGCGCLTAASAANAASASKNSEPTPRSAR